MGCLMVPRNVKFGRTKTEDNGIKTKSAMELAKAHKQETGGMMGWIENTYRLCWILVAMPWRKR